MQARAALISKSTTLPLQTGPRPTFQIIGEDKQNNATWQDIQTAPHKYCVSSPLSWLFEWPN